MAMDKDKLLAYFQAHYLSRREVLFKLPLSYSIDSFWPELLNRRKASAVVLPLYNAAGLPYWYVLTDRMIAASERLCEEAFSQEEDFDPYLAQMTSAMTEEMFFTSFVEGAQMPLQEAMDFLQRGTEPENIQEQMIWNNRHAWAEMTATLYRPLDEGFIRNLAFILTEEMDGCAEGYRQADSHPIAAMNDESYDVPPAHALPDRMRQYTAFLGEPNVHPLIKAAVAQAYLLVARPFPEGNERLSRMMSSAVLLRCGYDFFRDISISAIIAKESYRYYKSMREIIRAENGGDMTYFIEYYIELLVRAVDARKERLLRREMQTLERERELAREPLARTASNETTQETITVQETEEQQQDEEPAPEEKKYPVSPPIEIMPLPDFLTAVDKLKHSPTPRTRTYPVKIRKMIEMGYRTFTVTQWAEKMNMERKDADQECRYIFQKGFLDRDKSGTVMTYSFRYALESSAVQQSKEEEEGPEEETHQEENDKSPPEEQRFWNRITGYEHSDKPYKQRAGQFIRKLVENGKGSFTTRDLIEHAGLTPIQAKNMCDSLVRRKIVLNKTPHVKPTVFHIPLAGLQEKAEASPVQEHSPVQANEPEFWKEIKRMESSFSDMHRKTAETIRDCIEKGILSFSRQEWKDLSGLPKERSNDSCDLMLSRGLTVNISNDKKTAVYAFKGMGEQSSGVPSDEIVKKLKEMRESDSDRDQRIGQFLQGLIDKKAETFTAAEWGERFGSSSWTYGNDIRRALNIGLVRKTTGTSSGQCRYRICSSILKGVRANDLTPSQKLYLSKLYGIFAEEEFTVEDCAEAMGQQTSSAYFNLNNFAEREIVAQKGKNGQANVYSLLVTPETFPECFARKTKAERKTEAAAFQPSAPIPMAAAAG